MKTITITYDPDAITIYGYAKPEADLFSWLENELNDAGVTAVIKEVPHAD